ncbi:MAG: hypothetical protein WBQ94_26470 [Terracidiphilus sp.]
MRIPVFSRGSNPRVDRPNQRKSLAYGAEEVSQGRADWVDSADPAQGILCREFLYSGERLKPAEPEHVKKLSLRSALPPVEVGGTQFKDPEIRLSARQDRACLIIRARAYAHFCDLEAVAQ